MKSIFQRLKNENGAAQMVENIIVLPVVFAVIIFIIYMGQMQYQKALIASVAERAVIWIEQSESDYQYEKMATLDLSNGASDIGTPDVSIFKANVDRQPYRYVAGMFKKKDYSATEEYIKNYIESKEIFPMGEVSVEIEPEGSLYKKATIIIEQDLIALEILPGLDLPTLYHYKYQTESSVVQPAEMIRNTDFVYEIAEPYLDKATSELSNVVKKFKTVFDRIDIINKK